VGEGFAGCCIVGRRVQLEPAALADGVQASRDQALKPELEFADLVYHEILFTAGQRQSYF